MAEERSVHQGCNNEMRVHSRSARHEAAAHESGGGAPVYPHGPSAFTFAPCETKSDMISRCPPRVARLSAVAPPRWPAERVQSGPHGITCVGDAVASFEPLSVRSINVDAMQNELTNATQIATFAHVIERRGQRAFACSHTHRSSAPRTSAVHTKTQGIQRLRPLLRPPNKTAP